MPSQAQLQEWHKAFSRIERVDDHQRLTIQYKSVCRQIEDLKEDVENAKPPRNPREDAIQCHTKATHAMLLKQKNRLERQLKTLADAIAIDMEMSKNELQ